MEKPRVCLISHIYLEERYRGKLSHLAKSVDLKVIIPDRFHFPYGVYFIESSRIDGYQIKAYPCWYPVGIRTSTRWILGSCDLGLQRYHPDIIHIENEVTSFSVLQAICYRRLFAPTAKIIVFAWANLRLAGLKRFILNPLSSFMRRGIDFYITGNSAGKELLIEDGVEPDRISVFPHIGIDINYYTLPSSEERLRLRAQIGISAEEFVIGFVGRFVEEKGLQDLLEACQLLKSNLGSGCNRIRLLCVGDGPLKTDLLNRYPAVLVVSPGQASNVLPYYWIMDVMVLPSRTRRHWKEQFGLVLVEAMACGVTVVGSDSGEIPNVIDQAGFIFPEADIVCLANIFKRLFLDPQIRENYGPKGRQRVLDVYSEEKIAAQTLETYEQVLQLDRGSR